MYSEKSPHSPARNEIAIHIKGLSKRYAVYKAPLDRLKHVIAPRRKRGFTEFWALSDISLTIMRGETCAIIGRNGSGKSTLLQILCGTLRGTSGLVEVNGRVAALLELGAGFNNDFTGRENVYMNGAILGLSPDQIDARFSEIEAFAEIDEFIDQPVKTYSSGMYVRLAFAVAIHADPQILIVDEALAVGDSRFQAKCMNRIKAMQASGVTILFVSHDIGSVRTLCERALWLDHGKVRMLGDAFSVTAHYNQFLFEPEHDDDRFFGKNGNDSKTISSSKQSHNVTSEKEAEISSIKENITELSESTQDDAIGRATKQGPINHWGSHVGSILDAGIFNLQGERLSAITAFDEIEIQIKIKIPDNAERSTLSAAFSLKDLRGTDLIVSTTWDKRMLDFSQAGDTFAIRFRLKNPLNAGNYLLAVALEDRASVIPQYYEYIEGAHYFASLTDCRLYGSFVTSVDQFMDVI